MNSLDALRMLADSTAPQWGMVTSAQANVLGVNRLTLARLTDAGHLIRLSHGVYKDSGVPSDQFEDLRAAWLSTQPKVMGEARLRDTADGVVVAGTSAAALHGIGDLWADRHEFVSPTRRQSQRAEIRYRQRSLDPRDVVVVEGLPTMSIERTIADLLEDAGDQSLVADALRDAALKRSLDHERLRDLLSPLAARNGLRRDDGSGLLSRLLERAGIDTNTVASHIAADPALGSRVAASYLVNLPMADLHRLAAMPAIQETMRAIHSSIAATLDDALASQFGELTASADASLDKLVASRTFDRFTNGLTDRIPADNIVAPEMLSAVRLTRETRADD